MNDTKRKKLLLMLLKGILVLGFFAMLGALMSDWEEPRQSMLGEGTSLDSINPKDDISNTVPSEGSDTIGSQVSKHLIIKNFVQDTILIGYTIIVVVIVLIITITVMKWWYPRKLHTVMSKEGGIVYRYKVNPTGGFLAQETDQAAGKRSITLSWPDPIILYKTSVIITFWLRERISKWLEYVSEYHQKAEKFREIVEQANPNGKEMTDSYSNMLEEEQDDSERVESELINYSDYENRLDEEDDLMQIQHSSIVNDLVYYYEPGKVPPLSVQYQDRMSREQINGLFPLFL